MTENSFFYLDTSAALSAERYRVKLPYPERGNLSFLSSFNVKPTKTANGAIAYQLGGRAKQTVKVSYDRIDCDVWWALNRFVQLHGPVVFCRFFNHNLGQWEIREVLMDDFESSPEVIDCATGASSYYTDASFSVTDVGRETVLEE